MRDGDPLRDREAVLALWRGNLGDEARMAGKYDWFYQSCPFGPPLLRFLHHVPSDTRVGTCSAGARRLLWQGREISAGVLVDLAVSSEHRSLGPALMLQQGMIQAGHDRFDLLYGFPNAKAVPVFKRIGLKPLAEVTRYVRVLKHARYLRARMPSAIARLAGSVVDLGLRIRDWTRSSSATRVSAQWSDQSDARFDELWSRSRHGQGLVAIRDWRYAAWRFDQDPMVETKYLLLSEQDSGRLCGWFATHARNETLHVHDFWSVDAGDGLDTGYIKPLLKAARKAGYLAISVEMATNQARLAGWRALGFMARSKRPLLARWSKPDATVEGLDLHLTSADEDE